MKKTNKILTAIVALPFMVATMSAVASSNKVNQERWVAVSDTQAKVLAKGDKDSKGLTFTCFPGENRMEVKIGDLKAKKGTVVKYWTDKNQGDFITRSNGAVTTDGNDAQNIYKMVSDIAHDYNLKVFVEGQGSVDYSLVDSADTIRQLEGCGLPKRRSIS